MIRTRVNDDIVHIETVSVKQGEVLVVQLEQNVDSKILLALKDKFNELFPNNDVLVFNGALRVKITKVAHP
jgi:membrane protease subunit (stomatin/prohibitin family)